MLIETEQRILAVDRLQPLYQYVYVCALCCVYVCVSVGLWVYAALLS